MKEIVIRTFFE